MITFLVGDSCKPSFTTVTGRGPYPNYIFKKAVGKLHSMPCSLHPIFLEIQSATIKIQQPKLVSSVGEVTLSRSFSKFTKSKFNENTAHRLIMAHPLNDPCGFAPTTMGAEI